MQYENMDMFNLIDNVVNYGRLRALDNVTLDKFKAIEIRINNFKSERVPTGYKTTNGKPEYKTISNVLYTTASGLIEETEWTKKAIDLIHNSGEDYIFKRLLEYSKSCAWLKTHREVEHYALDLHIRRIFENTDWVYYKDFIEELRQVEV